MKVLLALVAPFLVSAEITADGNPYETAQTCTGPQCKCAAQAITPITLLHGSFHPNRFQDGQLEKIDTIKALGQTIPIYHFRQPAELNPGQLPFKIALLNQQMPQENIVIYKVEADSAANSWFPEYSWDIVVCTKDGGRHLGWRFVNKVDPTQYFHALIVDYDEKEKEVGVLERLVEGLRVVGQPLIATGLTLSQVTRMNTEL